MATTKARFSKKQKALLDLLPQEGGMHCLRRDTHRGLARHSLRALRRRETSAKK